MQEGNKGKIVLPEDDSRTVLRNIATCLSDCRTARKNVATVLNVVRNPSLQPTEKWRCFPLCQQR